MNENNENSKLIWHEKTRKRLLKTVVVDIMETISISPDEKPGSYIVMDARDWVITIPVLEDSFLMVKQWRHGEKELSIEFPGGVNETGEPAEIAAKRELLEETGYSAGKMVFLGSANPNPALMSNHVHFFAAFDLKKEGAQHLDKDEYVEFLRIPQKEVYMNFGTKEYQHALMGTALAFFTRYEYSLNK